MFLLVTGKPGASKTSHTIDFVLHDKRFAVDGSDERRPVYYRGIKELQCPWFELSDDETRDWPNHLPDGAVLLVDEAQQIWPVRPSSRPVPIGLTALETHRHRGWDIIFISQDPSLLDSHARKICNEHLHYSRPFQAPFCIEYHSGSGFVNPANKGELATCVQSKKPLPKRVFGLYKSAEVHTHKFKPPKIIFVLPVLVIVVIACIWMFKQRFLPSEDTAEVYGDAAPQQVAGVSRSSSPSSVADWPALLTPEVPGLPYTAPIYRESAFNVQAVPVISGCMAFETDQSDCRCYTQQGTRIRDLSLQVCKRALSDGVFNHLVGSDPEPSRGDERQQEPAGYRG